MYVCDDQCAYMFPSELTSQLDARDALMRMLSDETSRRVVYVATVREKQLDILAYPREQILCSLTDEMRGANAPLPPNLSDDDPPSIVDVTEP